jgi:3-oxoacyl-(acyl-carrier-protein) synthase
VSGTAPENLAHLNADGIGTMNEDRIEAEAIRDVLGDVPVTTQMGNCGELGSGTSSVALIASILSLQNSLVPPVRNHEKTASDCPIQVVHGKPLASSKTLAMKITRNKFGNSFAMLLEC